MTRYAEGSHERSLRVAVVGAGPAGFYTTEALVKQKQIAVEVDLFERLPAPYGLVRYGVAPDHQKIKSVSAAYDKLLAHPRVRLLANVDVGTDVTVGELTEHYDQVVFAVGCATDRHLGIAGEDLDGVHAATSFVAWYNGHPDFRDYRVNLDARRAAIVGVGDVSMDIARMLVRSPAELAATDIAGHAERVFRESRVEEVLVFGRRGPAQAAFATKELEDIVELPNVHVGVNPDEVRRDYESGEEFDGLQRRKLDYLAGLASRGPSSTAKRIELRFFASPVEILGEGGRVTALRIEHNEVVKDQQGKFVARGTGAVETIPVGLVFRSVGYRGVPIPGVPFDERRAIVPNRGGRVLRGDEVWPNVYVAGWIKRGPSGVIGTNKSDAAETVQRMLEDLGPGDPAPNAGRPRLDGLLEQRGVRVLDFAAWKRLDELERKRGAEAGKIREKFTRLADALEALDPRTRQMAE
jgi:ferredoxin--NADP+ reductase